MKSTTCVVTTAALLITALALVPKAQIDAVALQPSGYPCPSNPTLTCVMSGLDGPRGLAFGPEGALYVTEAGRGNANLENPDDGFCCFSYAATAAVSFGRSGGVSRLWRGKQVRFATGFPSLALPNGNRAVGAHDISLIGRGAAYVTIGLEGDPAVRERLAAEHPDFPDFTTLGHLAHVAASGEWRLGADISAFEAANNPDDRLLDDGSPHYDSNPYGILAEPGSRVVTDAGANALLRIDASGEIALLATFHSRGTSPPRPSFAPPRPPPLPAFDEFTDAVPTSVVRGPDRAYYVSELTGVPFVEGRANIYRVEPDAAPQTYLISQACLSGFKMVVDIAFADDGTLFVLQHATGAVQQPGAGTLIQINPDRTQPDVCSQYQQGSRTTVLGVLSRPTSLAIGPDGALYISNEGVLAGRGEVVRFER